MSRELRNALVRLLEMRHIMENVNVLLENYTEKDLQEAVLVKDFNGWLPIHIACGVNAQLDVIQMLLESDVEKKTIFQKDRRGRLPIHWACSTRAPVDLIQLLLESDVDKKTILEKDEDGRLPIHWACSKRAPVELIQLLLDSDVDKKTILEKDQRGRLPIHYACSIGAPVKVIQLLLNSDVDKKTILVKDVHGRLPIDSACLQNGPVEVIQLLLQASICDRIEQLGLAQWKIGVEKLINDMTADDSKTKKVQEIYKRLSNCEEMEHTMSLLALIVWRTSCLHWGDIQFKSMQEMEDLRATDGEFDPLEFKRERQIKSGADVIIRGVLPFLPVDDDSE